MKTKPNSLSLSLRGYFTAIFDDVRWMYGRPSDWKRDHSRLLHELGIRGHRLVTIDFPAIDKHFLKCLDQGAYTPCSLPLTRVCSKAVHVPAFLRGMYLRIFDSDGKLRMDPCPDAILGIRTILSGAKKLRLPYKKGALFNELNSFIECEQEALSPSLNWVGDDLFDPRWVSIQRGPNSSLQKCNRKHPADLLRSLHIADHRAESTEQLELPLEDRGSIPSIPFGLAVTMQQVADIVSSSLGDFHSENHRELPKHGPGVVSDLTKEKSKYDFALWTTKTESVFPRDRYGSPNLGGPELFSAPAPLGGISHEIPSRIIAVPKSAKGPRLIAAEPSTHQWLQQLVLSQLVSRIARSPVSVSVNILDQSRNREFARRGSLDGETATIDLSSASDRLSCWAVERFFRANITLLERLHACRTRSASWAGSPGYPPFGVILKKFAPMGSACTFPVQSIIYCIVAISAILYHENRRVTTSAIKAVSARCSVFGDDIIVPTSSCPITIQALEYLGLKVNYTKTFQTGKFRESCGIDAWNGYDVTPPYVLTLRDSDRFVPTASGIEVSNNFFTKGFWRTAKFLQDQLGPIASIVPVCNRRDMANIFYSYSGTSVSHLRSRWNSDLQRVEVRSVSLKTKTKKGPCSSVSRLFQWFIEKPRPDLPWESGVAPRANPVMGSGWHPVEKFTTRVNTPSNDQLGYA